MQDINLLDELKKAQQDIVEKHLLAEALNILSNEEDKESKIQERIVRGTNRSDDHFGLHKLDSDRIYDHESIEAICVKYRLRFLDSAMFKADVPAEAVRHIKHVEANTGVTFEHFRIVAPAERFKLLDSTKDPILLAQLPNGKYYFIHQWGDDMSWIQHVLKYPFRHMKALAISSITIGTIVALAVPSQFQSDQAEFFFRFFMFSMSSCLLMMIAIISGIMYSKDFSENVWNSKFIR